MSLLDTPIKTEIARRAEVEQVLVERDPTYEELEDALTLIRERRLARLEEERRLAEATQTNGFKHYFLANAKYPFEKVLIPGTNGQFYMFHRGRILIDSPEKEALIRTACAGRLHDEDLTEPRRCKTCQTLWFSSSALLECQLGH